MPKVVFTPSQLSPEQLAQCMPDVYVKVPEASCTTQYSHYPKDEGDLQTACELELVKRGYVKSSVMHADLIKRNIIHPQGIYYHLYAPEKNPLMPDLLIVRLDRPALQIELKVQKKFQPGQKEFISSGWWKLAWTVEEFVALLNEWEK